MTTIIVNGDKPELVSALKAMESNLKVLVETGDPRVHKDMTFAMRYSSGPKDERIYSNDPETIKAFWRDYFDGKVASPKPTKLGEMYATGSDTVGEGAAKFARSLEGLRQLHENGQGRDEGSSATPPAIDDRPLE